MEKQILYNKIEQYISGEMTDEEHSAFKAEIAADKNLAKEVALHSVLHESLADKQANEFLKTVKSVNASWDVPQQKGKMFHMNMRQWMAIAAVFVGIIVAVLFMKKGVESTNYYATNFEPYDMVLSYRGDLENVQLESAINAYNSKNYLDAETNFLALWKTNPDNTAYPFYLAMSQLAGSKDHSSFIPIFTQIAETEGHIFQQQARWYQAMAYLKVGKSDQAKHTLTLIKKGDYKYIEAQKLLSKL